MKIAKILLALLSVSVAAAAAQTQDQTQAQNQQGQNQGTTAPVQTPAVTTGKPNTTAPPTETPAPTTGKPTTSVPPVPTPATTTLKPSTTVPPAVTPAATKPLRSCWEVSVEHDATYCIDGPICSGSGAKPAGWNCPKKGAVAVADCYKYLKSYADAGKCVAPVDAECRVIKTGAWGCVWQGTPVAPVVTPASTVLQSPPTPTTDKTVPTTSPTVPVPTKDNGSTGSGTGKPTPTVPVNGSAAGDGETIQFPKQGISLSATGSSSKSSSSSSSAMIGGIAAIAGVACVVAGAAVYRRKQLQRQEVIDIESAISTPQGYGRTSTTAVDAPQTPPLRDSRRFFPSSTI